MAPWRYPDAAKRVRTAFIHPTGAEPASSDRSTLPDHSRCNDDTMFRCWLLGMGLPNIFYRPRGARHDQSGLWRRGLENPVLHRPYPPGRGQREDSWPPRADPEKIAYERPCLRYARGAARQEVPGRGSWEAREQIGEIAELLVVECVEHIRHRRVVGAARIVLVLS